MRTTRLLITGGQSHVYIYANSDIRELSSQESDVVAKQHGFASFQELLSQVAALLGLKHGNITLSGNGDKITAMLGQP